MIDTDDTDHIIRLLLELRQMLDQLKADLAGLPFRLRDPVAPAPYPPTAVGAQAGAALLAGLAAHPEACAHE